MNSNFPVQMGREAEEALERPAVYALESVRQSDARRNETKIAYVSLSRLRPTNR